MHAVNHFVTGFIKVKHSHGKKVPSGALYRGLEDATADDGISGPLPGVGVLAVNRNAELFTPPGCGEQLELWPLPTDKPATR